VLPHIASMHWASPVLLIWRIACSVPCCPCDLLSQSEGVTAYWTWCRNAGPDLGAAHSGICLPCQERHTARTQRTGYSSPACITLRLLAHERGAMHGETGTPFAQQALNWSHDMVQ
jgi:hypothetical protein